MISQEMLQYQKIDSELNRIERDLRKSDAYQNRQKFKSLRQEFEDRLIKLDTKAGELKSQLAAAQANLNKISAIIGEHNKEIADIQSEDELNYMSKKLTEQTELLAQAEKEIKRILYEGEDIARTFDEINAKLPQVLSAYKKSNEEFAKATEEVKPRVAELHTKQLELEKSIDGKLLAMYKKLSETIRPVFVPLRDENLCSGCNMDIPKAQIDSQMQEKGYVVCEHCGRIIYKA